MFKKKFIPRDRYDEIAKMLGHQDISTLYLEAFNNLVANMVAHEKVIAKEAQVLIEGGKLTKDEVIEFMTELRWQVLSLASANAAKDLGIMESAIANEILLKYEHLLNKDIQEIFNKVLAPEQPIKEEVEETPQRQYSPKDKKFVN